MSTIKKIVTHAGTFHADEVSAVALLLYLFPNTLVERTYTPSEEDFADPEVVVIDIGRRFEPELLNFDHHQDTELPASNMLVLDHFFELLPKGAAEYLQENLFEYISEVDCGTIIEQINDPYSGCGVEADNSYGHGIELTGVPTISSIIRACNNLHESLGWPIAMQTMGNVLQTYLAAGKKYVETAARWIGEVEKRRGNFAIFDSEDYLVGWETPAEKDSIIYLINRNKRGGYQITSRDSKRYPIPAHPSQTFLHNSGFIASYPTLEAAIEHAETL